jgi:hypothetical protein
VPVVVVPEPVVVVAGVVVVDVDVVGVVGVVDELLVVVVVEVVLVVVDVLFGGVVVVVVVVVVLPQSRSASCWTVDAPWLRLLCSVELIEPGRLLTSLVSADAALEAAPQLPDWTAFDTLSSVALRLFAWPLESRPAPPPQATRNETASPSPPARSARGA